jgi:hypothetical protein
MEASLSKNAHSPIDPQQSSIASITLEDVNIHSQLASRSCRPRDYKSEHRVLSVLAQEMVANPRMMLQKLAETALDLCNAETAVVSLLETQGENELFRWEGLAGVFGRSRYNTMPRNATPCGTCIDQNSPQLLRMPDRIFPALRTKPPFVEALLVPFHAEWKPAGTIWVVSHTEGRRFDREDERVMQILGQFASASWQLWKSVAIAA